MPLMPVMFLLLSSLIVPLQAQEQAATDSKVNYPQRIISLSPHTTELVFAAGGGDRLIGVSAYSDYPAEALKLPIVASSQQLNIEAILALEPDLVVYWEQGNANADINQLKRFGIPLFASKSGGLDDVAKQIEQLGERLGTSAIAQPFSANYRAQLAQLRRTYQQNPKQKLFYQIWSTPMMTVANADWLEEQFSLCGFDNVFSESPVPYPVINAEQVIAKQPEVIIAGSLSESELDQWRQWQTIPAVARDNLYRVNPDVSHRFSPRVLQGIKTLCEIAQQTAAKGK